MSPHQYLAVIRRYWAIVVIATLLGGAAAWGLSQLATPVFTAKASLYFSLNYGNTASDLNQGSTYTQSQMLSFAQLAVSPLVLTPAIDAAGLDETPKQLADALSVSTPQNTVVLEVAATDQNAERASTIANAVAESLSSSVETIAPKGVDGKTTVTARIIEPATTPIAPSSPNTRLNVAAGVLFGLIVGILILVLRELFDTRVRSTAAVLSMTQIPILGSIEREKGRRPGLVMVNGQHETAAESYRQLRANLAYVAIESDSLSIVVTSSRPGEGKSMIASNLAVALSESDRRVLLIDADLRRPAVAGYLGLEGAVGLTSVLVGRTRVDDVIQPTIPGGPDVLPAGAIPPNPSELLSSRAMSDLVTELKSRYDVILIDTAPMLAVADAAILARLVDGALVIADRTKVHRPQLAQTLDSLGKSGVSVLGIVLNRVIPSKDRQSYYTVPGAPQHGSWWRRAKTRHTTPAARLIAKHAPVEERAYPASEFTPDPESHSEDAPPSDTAGQEPNGERETDSAHPSTGPIDAAVSLVTDGANTKAARTSKRTPRKTTTIGKQPAASPLTD